MSNLKRDIQNYLKLEMLRIKLAKKTRLEDLKKTYRFNYVNQLNPNTKKFWNEKAMK